MSSHQSLARALADLAPNSEQSIAAHEKGHCVVLAGPGSGKTKTLTTAIARALIEDVPEPRGVACITYNNECAGELEERLAKLEITSSDRCFIGTVHSFALTQVISPYARCIEGLLPNDYRVATRAQCRAVVEVAYAEVFGGPDDPHARWRFAEEKRRRDVDRSLPAWRDENPELADFVDVYEAELRREGLIDFDDMPLIAFRMIRENQWIRDALRARYPVLFVDEYQDLGHALHELVLLLCFHAGIRLFAVGDADQSIYSFTGANPQLLLELTARPDVRTVRLRFNYRSGAKIIRASLGALGEERDYRGVDGAPEGDLRFRSVPGGLDQQAQLIAKEIVPELLAEGVPPEQIAVLYRAAWLGDKVAQALEEAEIPFIRTDANALIKRNSRFARFIEACAQWVTGGWREADPRYDWLLREACRLVYGGRFSDSEEQEISRSFIAFLRSSIDGTDSTHGWLLRFHAELASHWMQLCRNVQQEWDECLDLAKRMDPKTGSDVPLNILSGRIEGCGRVTLSSLHSAKGREFDAVVLFGMNDGDLPNWRDKQTPRAMREARRLFYVGVTRPRRILSVVYQKKNHSPWLVELYERSRPADEV